MSRDRQSDGVLDETVSLAPPATDRYGQNKLLAEREVQKVAERGLSSIILRPTRIYGPFSKTFTISPLQAISAGRFAIRGDGNVPANMVYVDNVVEAIARALDAPAPSGSAYLVSDPEQVSLREFYDYFARAAGFAVRLAPPAHEQAAPNVPEALALAVRIRRSPRHRSYVRWCRSSTPIHRDLPSRRDRSRVGNAACRSAPTRRDLTGRRRFRGSETSIRRAGACPSRSRGTRIVQVASRERAALTLEWARYARLLPKKPEALYLNDTATI
jgi:hypothetical protein